LSLSSDQLLLLLLSFVKNKRLKRPEINHEIVLARRFACHNNLERLFATSNNQPIEQLQMHWKGFASGTLRAF
jgi:uncharacterized protein (DUF849 family)